MKPLLLALFATPLLNGALAELTENDSRLAPRAISIPDGYSQTLFADDFSLLVPGTQPSRSKWTYDLGTSYPGGPARWGTNEIQSYTQSTNNIVITPTGTLRITPRKSGNRWTSARIETSASYDFACAAGQKLRIESSLKLGSAPASQQLGIWPAFWSLGAEFRGHYDRWPAVGELDIMDNVNGASTIWNTIHCGFAPGGPCNEYTGVGGTAGFDRSAFHTVAAEIDRTNTGGDWSGEKVTWFVDGQRTASVTGSQINNQTAWTAVTRDAKFLLLNVAVGGDFPDNAANPNHVKTPTAQTVDGAGAAMEVRYVAVFST